MKPRLYAKDYSNQSLTIPSEIWNNNNINILDKVMLALYRKLTHQGRETIDYMTVRQSEILGVDVSTVEKIARKLEQKGFIKITGQGRSKKLHYTYRPQPVQTTQDTSQLF